VCSLPHRTSRVHAPAVCEDVRLVKRPIAPCALIPAGSPGQVLIEGVPYTLTYNLDTSYRILGFRLVNVVNKKVYDVEGVACVSCTCGDFVYRREGRDPRGCKHMIAMKKIRGMADAGCQCNATR
jgi:hypothetical protein